MFITERRRQVYDEKGALYKIDLLRSIRRKDAPQSMLRATEQDEQKLNQCSGESKWKKIAQAILIVIIIGACCMLVYNLTRQFSSKASGYQQMGAILSDCTLREVPSVLGVVQREEELLRRFVGESRCRVQSGGVLSCRMSLDALGVKMQE